MMIKLKFTLAAAAAMVLVGCSTTTTTTTMAPIEDHATTAPAATSVPVNEGSSQMVTPYLAKENAKDSGRTHMVVAGDTLYNIGVRYGVNPREIASLNGITDPTTMSLGLVLKIPEAATKAPEATSATETTVAGETVVVTTTAETEKPVTVEVAKRPDTPEEAAQSELAQAESLRKAAAQGQAKFPWPASGAVIANFTQTNRAGIDIAGSMGDPVKVILDGTVHYVGNGAAKGYGNFVIVKHNVRLPGSGTTPLVTVYGNAKEILVRMGESVRQGQTIATMGNSDSDHVKLRFEMRQGAPVDPMKYLQAR